MKGKGVALEDVRRVKTDKGEYVGVTVEKTQYLDLEKLAAAAMAVD